MRLGRGPWKSPTKPSEPVPAPLHHRPLPSEAQPRTRWGVLIRGHAPYEHAGDRLGGCFAGSIAISIHPAQQHPVSPTLHFSGARQAVCFVPR